MFVDIETKYKPKTLEEFVFENDIVEQVVRAYGTGKMTRPLILSGSNGTGKSLLAELIPKTIEGFVPQITHVEAIDYKSKKEVLAKFSRSKQFDALFTIEGQRYNYNILEEMDFEPSVSKAFRVVLDKFRGIDLTIITTNDIGKIDIGITSRCEVLDVPAVSPKRFLQRAKDIVVAEGFSIDDTLLLEALEEAYNCRPENRSYYKELDRLLVGV